MRNIHELEKQIFRVTYIIQQKFPQLYELLNETPLFLSYQEKEITIKELSQYLESLIAQLKTYEQNENAAKTDRHHLK